jgi:phenylalanyl-tRNA synthetase beta chain
MLVTLKWLEDLLGTSLDPEEVKSRVLDLGLEVEEEKKQAPDHIIIGRINSIEPHPKLKNLDVLIVKTRKNIRIVTAAKNIQVNDHILLIPAGKTLKGEKIIEKDFAGITSQGILISEQELGLADKSTGVIVLEKGEPGALFKDYFDDLIFDMGTTPNRPDWLSIQGIAREIGICLNHAIPRNRSAVPKQTNRTGKFKIEIKDLAGCPRYTARIFDNVLVKDSPFWIKWRLHCLGMNPVNNVVDITNIVMLLTGQPLHPFDMDLLKGYIIVRRARDSEKFVTLEGTELNLDKNDCVITDSRGVIALGGIIGAQCAQISHSTKKVVLESAYFDPRRIAHTSRRLELLTEASTRFERGADMAVTDHVSSMTGKLFKKYAGGKEIEFVGAGKKAKPIQITFSADRMNEILSTRLTDPQIKKILKKIDISVAGSKTLTATIPHYRRDINIPEDIYEEVARIYGYMKIPEIVPQRWGGQITINKHRVYEKAIRNYLIGQGFSETYNLSLIASERLLNSGFKKYVKIQNPLNERFNALRPTLFLGLLDCVNYNLSKGNRSLKLFEIGNVLLTEAPYQEKRMGMILGGEKYPDSWNQAGQLMDYYDTKGVVESIFDLLHIKNTEFKITKKQGFSQTADIILSGKNLGYLGCIDRSLCKERYYYIELSWDKLQPLIAEPFYIPPAKFPASIRDLSFLVDEGIEVPAIFTMINKVGGPVLERVILFDYYKGKNLPPDKKNLGFRLFFRSPDRTLTDKEVDKFIQKIENDVSENFSAKLRKKE